MKRCVLTILIFLLLGAAVNVGLIYGIWLRLEPAKTYMKPLDETGAAASPLSEDAVEYSQWENSSPSFGTVRRETLKYVYRDGQLFGSVQDRYDVQSGWPC